MLAEKLETGASRQAELTAQLKSWTRRVSEMSTERASLTGKIYRAAYEWIGIAMVRKTVKSAEDGARRLADTIGVKRHTIVNWYQLGKFMAENGLETDRVSSAAVRKLQGHFGFISKSEQLRGLQLVKGGCDSKEIIKMMGNSSAFTQRSANRRADRLMAARKLSRNRIRLEMLALKTLACKFYGTEHILIQIVKDAKVQEVL